MTTKTKVKKSKLPKAPAVDNVQRALRGNRGLSNLVIDCMNRIQEGNRLKKEINDTYNKPALNDLKTNGFNKRGASQWVTWLKMELEERRSYFEDLKIVADAIGEQFDLFGEHASEIPEAVLDARQAALGTPLVAPDPEQVAKERSNVTSITDAVH